MPASRQKTLGDVEVKQSLVEPLARAEVEDVERVGVVCDEYDPRRDARPVDLEAGAVPVAQREQQGTRASKGVPPPAAALAAVHQPGVEPERDVVQEELLAHAPHVDLPLDPGESVERRNRVVAVEPEVAGEVVARAVGDADEGNVPRDRDRCHGRERAVATGHAEHVGVGGLGQLDEILPLADDVHRDAAPSRFRLKLADARPRLSRARIDEEARRDPSKVLGLTRVKIRPRGLWGDNAPAPIMFCMSERGLHYIEDDLSESWLEDWAGAGVAEIEVYLSKHAAFLRFLDSHDS